MYRKAALNFRVIGAFLDRDETGVVNGPSHAHPRWL
jgi:hypothetical protein